MKLNDFHYSLSLLNMLYGIDLPEDDFEEIALTGFGLIGNKRVRLYRYATCVEDCKDGIQLPCNVDTIEAVTAGFEDYASQTNDTPDGDIASAVIETYIENRKAFRNPLYQAGKLIKYEQVGDMIYFDRPYGRVNILYKGELLDDDGLPQITDKEARALATYVAYIIKYREGISTNNVNIINIATDLQNKWNTQCDQARVDYPMSQNDFDQILDAKTNWTRKQYGKSYKGIQ